jgi:hypothetical protein
MAPSLEFSRNGSDLIAIPHLHCIYRYGVSVADEWHLIGLLLDYSEHNDEIVIRCWDVDDGQVLLIQSADALPPWVDQIGPDQCRHRCWIRSGHVLLLAPADLSSASLSLASALELLRGQTTTNPKSQTMITSPRAVHQVIQETIQTVQADGLRHRTPLAVPRSVAYLLQHRPNLCAVACRLFFGTRQSTTTTTTTTVFIISRYLRGLGLDHTRHGSDAVCHVANRHYRYLEDRTRVFP